MGVRDTEAGGPRGDDTLGDGAWLTRAAALTAEATDDHETARAAAAEALVFRLTAVAAALCAAAPGRPLADEAASDVARRLAAAYAAPAALPRADPRALAADFAEALQDATVAVYFCRSTQHPGHRCWFTTAGPADGLCGEVLALAHRLAPRTEGRQRVAADHTGCPR